MRLGFWRERKQNQRRRAELASPGQALDRDLAERIGKGDSQALAMWLDRHMATVHGYLTRRLGPGNEELAAEVTRATFESAMRHLKPYARGTASTPMSLWLIHRSGDQLTRRRGKIEPPSSRVGESRQLTRLREIMHTISPRREAALSLALFEGKSAPEIATALGTSQARAMRILRSALRAAQPAAERDARESSRGG